MRLIPARAGTTPLIKTVTDIIGAHPRSRGDHSDSAGELHGVRGSSPLARGPRPRCERPPCHRGLIPARAGTTSSARRAHDIKRAHPRSRGDHGVDAWYAPGETGSSPLARGPPATPPPRCTVAGLIPARAGTTRQNVKSLQAGGAHPRSRGDHMTTAPTRRVAQGSSPLARGPRTGLFMSLE